jgi:hypothetical protein
VWYWYWANTGIDQIKGEGTLMRDSHSIFEHLGTFPVKPPPKRYGITVFGIKARGTIREWVEDALATILMAVFFAALYVYVAVII